MSTASKSAPRAVSTGPECDKIKAIIEELNNALLSLVPQSEATQVSAVHSNPRASGTDNQTQNLMPFSENSLMCPRHGATYSIQHPKNYKNSSMYYFRCFSKARNYMQTATAGNISGSTKQQTGLASPIS